MSTIRKLSKRLRDITIASSDNSKSFTLRMNNVDLKTPMHNVLRVNNEFLALAIANEWKSRADKDKLDLSNMHLTTLTYSAIDNPFKESQEVLIKSIIDYLSFDTVRFRETTNEQLLARQSRHWDPMVGWFEHRYSCHLPIEYDNVTETKPLPDHTIRTMNELLRPLDRWPLVGLKFVTQNLKSLVLASSLTDKFLKVDDAIELARLEVKFQTEKWTKVEWEHDLDEQCTKARVAAGALFYQLFN